MERNEIFQIRLQNKSNELYPSARQECIKNSLEKSRKPANLPCETDLRKLKAYISTEISYIMQNYTLKNFVWLRSLVVARLTLFNARRGEEASRMLTNEWEDAKNGVWIQEDEIEKISDPAEQYLVDNFKMAYLKGKGRKYVPVLIPVDLIQAIDRISNDRLDFGIRKENPFLFATKTGFSHCSGWHAVAEGSEKAGISIPVTATKMRHRLSSIYASLEMKPEDRKIFLEYMGHEESINRENYQCPPAVRTARVMGKMLTTIDGVKHNGNTENDESESGKEDHEDSINNSSRNQRNKSVKHNGNTENDESESGKEDHEDSINNSSRNQRNKSVKWSRDDTSILRNYFKDYIYQTGISSKNQGPLPRKESIIQFIDATNLQSIKELTAREKYIKVRSKLFNERKTLRAKTSMFMKKLSGTD